MLRKCLYGISILLFSLYDLYFLSIGFPVVPVFGFVLFGVAFVYDKALANKSIRIPKRLSICSLTFLLITYISALWGSLVFQSDSIKSTVGITMGLSIFTLIASSKVIRLLFSNLFNIVLIIHFLAFVFQLIFWVITHHYLDFIGFFTDSSTRYTFETYGFNIVRFTGLFVEPTHYSFFAYTGLSVRLLKNGFKLHFFDFLLAVSIAASLSISGYFLLFFLFIVYFYHHFKILGTKFLKKNLKFYFPRKMVVVLLFFVGLSLIFLLVNISLYFENQIFNYLVQRISSPLEDHSGYARLISGFSNLARMPLTVKLFGAGIDNHFMIPTTSNGVAYLISFTGIIGTLLITLLTFLLTLAYNLSLESLMLFSFSLLLAPAFTNLYWWFWLGLLFLFGKNDFDKRHEDLFLST